MPPGRTRQDCHASKLGPACPAPHLRWPCTSVGLVLDGSVVSHRCFLAFKNLCMFYVSGTRALVDWSSCSGFSHRGPKPLHQLIWPHGCPFFCLASIPLIRALPSIRPPICPSTDLPPATILPSPWSSFCPSTHPLICPLPSVQPPTLIHPHPSIRLHPSINSNLRDPFAQQSHAVPSP